MTLDEAIEHAREVADNWKTQAHHFDGDSSEEANDLKTGCFECAKEHEQLAEWLEELKRYKAQKFVIKIDYNKAPALKELLRYSQFGIAYPEGQYEVVPLIAGGPSDEELKARRETDRWIPVSERLPDEDGQYEVTREEYIPSGHDYHTFDPKDAPHWEMVVDIAKFEGNYNRANGLENFNNGFNKAYRVHAWRPLPEPYKENGGKT